MHIAIDDTYGPTQAEESRYMTGRRRTYVAIEFPDAEVEQIRGEIRAHLTKVRDQLDIAISEFHFFDIYNRKKGWSAANDGENLLIFELFSEIYKKYRWKVHVQTVDDRTLKDHKLKIVGRFAGIDVTKRQGQALMFLLTKLKTTLPRYPEPLIVRIDEGERKPGARFAHSLFKEWGEKYDGLYASSAQEPLLQIADFMAFSINRSTHLQMKSSRTETDLWFLRLVGAMGIQSEGIRRISVPLNFTTADIDQHHEFDRRQKGLE